MAYTIAKYTMWVLVSLAFLGWFVQGLIRGNAGASLWMGLCLTGLVVLPIASAKLRGH